LQCQKYLPEAEGAKAQGFKPWENSPPSDAEGKGEG